MRDQIPTQSDKRRIAAEEKELRSGSKAGLRCSRSDELVRMRMGNGWDKTPLRHQDKSGPVTCTSLSLRLHIYSHILDRSVVFCFLAEVLSTWNLRFQGDGYKWFLRLIPLAHCFQDHFAKLGSWEIESSRSCLLIISLVWEASLCVGQGLEWLLQRSVGCGFVPVFDTVV